MRIGQQDINNMEYSITYASLIAALAGMIVFTAGQIFKIKLLETEVVQVLSLFVNLIGVLIAIYRKASKENINLLGFRKKL
jgi:hypothetical protein